MQKKSEEKLLSKISTMHAAWFGLICSTKWNSSPKKTLQYTNRQEVNKKVRCAYDGNKRSCTVQQPMSTPWMN